MVNIIAHGFEKVNKIELLKSKALLERVRGIAPPSPFRKKSILVIEINPQKI